MKRKIYEEPVMEVISFESEDVITTSGLEEDFLPILPDGTSVQY